jgi:uncharacterized membrane protein YhaH (DUF805 family)
MLGFLFGFNARLGRLHFFLGIIALAVASVAIDLALSPYSIRQLASGAKPPADQYAWPLIVPTVAFLLIKYTLKSMRIRDMGWDPVCVVPAWIALGIVDSVVASKVPAWSIGHLHHHGTMVGTMIQVVLLLALTFWPSAEFEAPTPTFGGSQRTPQGPSQGSNAASLPAARMARATEAGFGRRAS